jgi:hypothetical protein
MELVHSASRNLLGLDSSLVENTSSNVISLGFKLL